jgi:hypothetical protein
MVREFSLAVCDSPFPCSPVFAAVHYWFPNPVNQNGKPLVQPRQHFKKFQHYIIMFLATKDELAL